MKLLTSIKENKNGYLISTAILSFCIFIIHKAKYRAPSLETDMLLTNLFIAPILLFGLMVMMIFLIGDKE